jgi:hypothetical protein
MLPEIKESFAIIIGEEIYAHGDKTYALLMKEQEFK